MPKKADDETLTYYEILGVKEDATLSEIKHNFRELVKKFHPDTKKTGDAYIFALVAKAYECLSDKSKREDYDASLKIEKKVKHSDFFHQKESFEDFIKAQESDPTGEKKKLAQSRYQIEFAEYDKKRNFDRIKYEAEKNNPLTSRQITKNLDDLMQTRENDDIELTPKRLFKNDQFNDDQFNELFERKYKSKDKQLVKHGNPDAFNVSRNGVSVSSFDADEEFGLNDDHESGLYSSILDSPEDIEISDSDIKNMKKFSSYKTKSHNEGRGVNNENEIMQRLREREMEDMIYEKRTMKDFSTDMTNEFTFLHQVGLTGREIEWEDEENDQIAVQKLLEYRKNQRSKKPKNKS